MLEELKQSVETTAIFAAEAHYKGKGWSVLRVSRVRGDHSGYDFYLERGDEVRRVEVKGCSAIYGIPDLYETEIDPETMLLVADELCVVYCSKDLQIPRIAVIPREEIPAMFVKPKLGYRISGKFKSAKYMDKFFAN